MSTERFDTAAKDWDRNDFRTQLSNNIGRTLLEHVPLSTAMHLMDFGAGTGLLTEKVAPYVQSVAAVDLSPGMLNELSQKPALAGTVTPYCRNILHEPFEEDFDGIISAMALHHVEDTREILGVFFEHVKPGGFIAIADLDAEDGSFHTHGNEGVFHFGFERDALASLCREIGFEDVSFYTAHEVIRDNGRRYPIFLMSAKRR